MKRTTFFLIVFCGLLNFSASAMSDGYKTGLAVLGGCGMAFGLGVVEGSKSAEGSNPLFHKMNDAGCGKRYMRVGALSGCVLTAMAFYSSTSGERPVAEFFQSAAQATTLSAFCTMSGALFSFFVGKDEKRESASSSQK